jgi:hypothetical protein
MYRISVAAMTVLAVVSCRPPAEDKGMPVLISNDGDGISLEIPLCMNDYVAMFDVADGEDVMAFRWKGKETTEMETYSVTLSEASLRDETFDPEKRLKVVGTDRVVGAPTDLSIFVTTSRGFSEFQLKSIMSTSAELPAVVVGRDEPVFVDGEAGSEALAEWCAPG